MDHMVEMEQRITALFKGEHHSNRRVKRQKRFIRRAIFRAIEEEPKPSKEYPVPWHVVNDAFNHACWLLNLGYQFKN